MRNVVVGPLALALAALGACGGVSSGGDGGGGAGGTHAAGSGGAAGTSAAGIGGASGSAGTNAGTGGAGGGSGHGTGGAAGHATAGAGGAAGHGGASGASGSGGSAGKPCVDTACPGECEGSACDGAWTCDTQVGCSAIATTYCGCDGQTFIGSSCPQRAFAFRGSCEGGVSCDATKVLCKLAPPPCPSGQVPSVSGSCYGPCVPLEDCTCAASSECPSLPPSTPGCLLPEMRCRLSTI